MDKVTVFLNCGKKRKEITSTRDQLKSVIAKRLKFDQDFILEESNSEGTTVEWSPVDAKDVKDRSHLRVIVRPYDATESSSEEYEDCVEPSSDDDGYHQSLLLKLAQNNEFELKDRQYLHEMLLHYQKGKLKTERKKGEVILSDKKTQTELLGGVVKDLPDLLALLKTKAGDQSLYEQCIKKVMDITFQERRDFILENSPRVKDICDCYPTLYDMQQIIMEFCRIKEPNFQKNFIDKLDKCKYSIVKHAPATIRELQIIQHAEHEAKSADEKSYVMSAGALLLLPSYLKEDLRDMITFLDPQCKWNYPQMFCDVPIEYIFSPKANFKIFVERELLCTSKSFVDAFFGYCATFYIFNIQYPDETSKTMCLVEALLLGITPEWDIIPENVTELQTLFTEF